MEQTVEGPPILIVPGLVASPNPCTTADIDRILSGRVIGFAFKHPKFADATPIETTPVIAKTIRHDRILIRTKDGRVYIVPRCCRGGIVSVDLPNGKRFLTRWPTAGPGKARETCDAR